ncbi:hypothetical protein A5819_003753 [Enterococcus sp. 7E2_DIV0204]|uniref:hypothetical protein n=1 Tax=unclassified Enterococcus TaxID=2608891 RepID=UPI000A33C62D|nr:MULTISPECIES: hypothetical protein [unclassified Enterococcus]OTN83773.1 hypothetical protein A5819_003753 [Enterococcus sp. 7E2_DIV0204]OTP47144.1 hypothetical protein A5884_003681 [Enterococcus sp. 7D2_DIV0200]
MKKERIKKRQLFMLFALVVLVGSLYIFNSRAGRSTNLPASFVLKDSSTESTEEKTTDISLETSGSKLTSTSGTDSSSKEYTSTYNGEQDIAAKFAMSYLSFSTDSISSVKSIIDPSLLPKLEKLKGEEQEIEKLSLLDKSTVDGLNIYVYEFKAALKDSKHTPKTGKLFVIMKPSATDKETSLVNDLEWTYET